MRTLFFGFVFTLAACASSWAQEDLEPRIVGDRGTTTVGLSGFIDKYSSSESTFPTHATINTDVTHFIRTFRRVHAMTPRVWREQRRR